MLQCVEIEVMTYFIFKQIFQKDVQSIRYLTKILCVLLPWLCTLDVLVQFEDSSDRRIDIICKYEPKHANLPEDKLICFWERLMGKYGAKV